MDGSTETETRILDAARRLFAERGYVATTTRAIAREAGVNEVTLFRRFSNKAGLLQALGARIAAAQADRSPGDPLAAGHASSSDEVCTVLTQLARSEIQSAMQDGGLVVRLAFDARSVPEVGAVLGDAATANLEHLAERMAAWQRAGALRRDLSPGIMAEAFFSLTSSYVMFRQLVSREALSEHTLAAEAEQLVTVLWNGIAAQDKPQRRTKRKKADRRQS